LKGNAVSKKKILMVDDDHAVTDYMSLKLGKFYDVVVINEPKGVVRLARMEHPDLILCDIDMPEMDGGDVSRALSEDPETRHIPLVYLTSLVSVNEALERQGQLGGRPGMSKHAPIEETLAHLKAILGD
jgi:CheY-like chemotaxis protein